MKTPGDPLHGRGSALNPPNRFEPLHYDAAEIDGHADPEQHAPATQFLSDTSRSIISYNDSPDVGFSASINPYRGCEHGCAYCYARPYHEYLGFSAGLDFETRILVKRDAPELLRKELASPKWQPQPIGLSGVTDCYQPIERRLQLTRGCLEVLLEARNPVVIVTKNHLVSRDADLLSQLARYQASAVFVSLTTLDEELRRKLEPRTSSALARLSAVRELHEAGVPVGVMIAPVIPGLNEHEMPSLLQAAAEAGAGFAGWTMLRLPFAVKDIFASWLDRHYPERKAKVLGRIREVRDGKLNESSFGSRMRGTGRLADLTARLFKLARQRAGIPSGGPTLSTASFRRPGASQGLLFAEVP